MTTITIKAEHARLLFKRLMLFTAKDSTRPILEHIHLTPLDGRVVGAAADGFTLGVQSVPATIVEGGDPIVVHRDVAQLLVRQITASNLDASLQISSADEATICVFERMTVSNTALGNFPDYQKLIPDELGTPTAVALSAAFMERVAKAVKVDRDSTPIIRCYTDGHASPTVYTAGADDLRFMAIVMPMFVDWTGDHYSSAVRFLKAFKPEAADKKPRKAARKKAVAS